MSETTLAPSGLVVYFRTMAAEGNILACSSHPTGRSAEYDSYRSSFVILDESGKVLGIYPLDFVACILPLQTVGPSNADLPK